MNNREIEMIETVTKRNLPDEFSEAYETKGAFNLIKNKFIELGNNKTKWIAENDFLLSGFMWLMGLFMPGAFRKESFKYINQFKEFAESETRSRSYNSFPRTK